jgi:ParB-like chromosome segregation protein Spo0J
MKEWGWTNPVLADEAGGVIVGHARLLAARQLGIAEVPVMVARGWTDAQKRAYVIADNKLAENAGWDRELLGLELGELKLGGFDRLLWAVSVFCSDRLRRCQAATCRLCRPADRQGRIPATTRFISS